MGTPIRVVAGLGNPGARYARTPHNAGFLWLDRRLAGIPGGPGLLTSDRRAGAETGTDPSGVLLVRPLTFMNRSGTAVAAVMRRRGLAPGQLLVVHDDADFPPGTARLKLGGGSAGHKGIESIAERLGSAGFWRLRVGVGKGPAGGDAGGHVLRRMAPADLRAVEEAVDRSIAVLPALLAGDAEAAMRTLHAPAPAAPRAGEGA